jgi:uncharacterized protein (TIGR00255 family)
MTGYGSAERATKQGLLSAELRSVNHRYCEISLRLPRAASGLEGRVRQLLTERLSRGKLTLSVTWEGFESEGGRLRVDHEAARQYLAAALEIKEKYNLIGEVDVRGLLSLPDVLAWDKSRADDDALWADLGPVLEAVVANMATMKVREGASLTTEFVKRLARIEDLVGKAEARAPLRPAEAQERMLSRLKPLLSDVPVDPVRLAQEIAFLAERLDCTEECVRLRAHIAQFRSLFDDAEPAGRKLNFLLQEMNREANTIGSKSNDVETTRAVIVIKEEIERLREQVQNVE